MASTAGKTLRLPMAKLISLVQNVSQAGIPNEMVNTALPNLREVPP
jgi:hypothetical protein